MGSGSDVEKRLEQRMKHIAESIENCAETCDTFKKKSFIGIIPLLRCGNTHTDRRLARLFKSKEWNRALVAFMSTFEDHRAQLHEDIVLWTSFEVKSANSNLEKLMEFFDPDRLGSDIEAKLLKFIQKRGAEEILADVSLQQDLENFSHSLSVEEIDRPMADNATQWDEAAIDWKQSITEMVLKNRGVFEKKFQLSKQGLDVAVDLLPSTQIGKSSSDIRDPVSGKSRCGSTFTRTIVPDHASILGTLDG